MKLPIFRTFRHPELLKIGAADGVADAAFLSQATENTNVLIRRKSHIPEIRETHDGAIDGASRGWVASLQADGDAMLGDLDLTERGLARIKAREFRFLSASFRRNAKLTGDDPGETLPGPYLHHVALCNDPRIKGLVDLAEVQFDEGGKGALYLSASADGEVTYFSEIPPTDGPVGGSNTEDDMPITEAQFSDLEKRFGGLEARFAEKAAEAEAEKKRADEAEAKFAEAAKAKEAAEAKLAEAAEAEQKRETEAQFAAFDAVVDQAAKESKLGAFDVKRKKDRYRKIYEANPELAAEFAEDVRADLKRAGLVIPKPLGDGAADEEGSEERVTRADFSASTSDLKVSDKVSRAYHRWKASNPKGTLDDFAATVSA